LEAQKQTPTVQAAVPKAPKPPKEAEPKPPEPLTAEEQELLAQLRPEIEPVIERVLAAHPSQVESYRKGKTGLLGVLISQVMKQPAEGWRKRNPKLISVMGAERLQAA